jgi:hypothetical protein
VVGAGRKQQSVSSGIGALLCCPRNE